MAAFIGPLHCCGHQRYAELQAALEMDHSQADEEELRQVFQGGFGYGRGYRLMRPDLFLRSPHSYNVTLGGKTVHVGKSKKCFVIRKSPPPVAGCRNRVNKRGDLTIGFGHGRRTGTPATLADTRKPWKLVLDVLGIGENDGQTNARGLEQELLCSSCDEEGQEDGGEDSDGTDPEMPGLKDAELPVWADANERAAERMGLLQRVAELTADKRAAEVTADNRSGSKAAATPVPQAMEVSAGSSTDVPGSSYAIPRWQVDEKPYDFAPPCTAVVQPTDIDMHQQFTAGFDCSRERFTVMSLTCSHTRAAGRPVAILPGSRPRFTINTRIGDVKRAESEQVAEEAGSGDLKKPRTE